jgi:hypothetical protein
MIGNANGRESRAKTTCTSVPTDTINYEEAVREGKAIVASVSVNWLTC